METPILSSPTGENFGNTDESNRFYRLTTAELVHFCEAKYAPSVVKVYYYIKTIDPFGNGFPISRTQIATALKYCPRTISRAINTLVKAGELALAIVEAHVKLVATTVQTVAEIVSKLGQNGIPTPVEPEPLISVPIVETVLTPIPTPFAPTALISMPVVETVLEPVITSPVTPQPQQSEPTITTFKPKAGLSSVGNVIESLDLRQPTAATATIEADSIVKTPQWYAGIESRLNTLDIKLADVLHALKKYPVRAIEDAIVYTQKQTWSKAKAGVFVNYLKKWTESEVTSQKSSVKSQKSESVVTALMKRFPEIANTLAKEQNPIDEATLDYLQRLKVEDGIYDMQYSSIHNFFGVFITIKDYPHPIPWWEAIGKLQLLYPDF
jgi:hypothetical protein